MQSSLYTCTLYTHATLHRIIMCNQWGRLGTCSLCGRSSIRNGVIQPFICCRRDCPEYWFGFSSLNHERSLPRPPALLFVCGRRQAAGWTRARSRTWRQSCVVSTIDCVRSSRQGRRFSRLLHLRGRLSAIHNGCRQGHAHARSRETSRRSRCWCR